MLIREQAQGLLPIALAGRLCKSLEKQLTREENEKARVAVEEALRSASKTISARLRRVAITRGSRTTKLIDTDFYFDVDRIVKACLQTNQDRSNIVHDLSRNQVLQIRSWMSHSINEVPKTLRELGLELESIYREQQQIERDLGRVPSIDQLKPLLEMFGKQNEELALALSELMGLQDKVNGIEAELRNLERKNSDLLVKLADSSAQKLALERAEIVQTVLLRFKSLLVRKKLGELEVEASRYFGLLSRKTIMRRINIDATSFAITITDEFGHHIAKEELSAGEKQIYAISMLWALAKVSGRPLPLIIDTPLGRLDREHRALLGQHYFRNASHQVIILSTDTEVDRNYLPLIKDAVSRYFELWSTPNAHRTEIRVGYFSELSLA